MTKSVHLQHQQTVLAISTRKMKDYSQYGSDSNTKEKVEENEQAYYYEEPYQEIGMATQCCAEFLGTFTSVLIGVGAECISLQSSTSKYGGGGGVAFFVACMWAVGTTLGIYISGPLSGGHVNPAVSLSFAIVRPSAFPFYKIFPFIISQVCGGLLAGLTNLLLFHQVIKNFEKQIGCDSSSKGSGRSASSSCCLESAAGFSNYWSLSNAVSDEYHAYAIEAFGTGFVVFIIFMVTSSKYTIPDTMVPPIVALAFGSMVALLRPLTGAGLNPARDIGPRLITFGTHWGEDSMKDFLPYLAGPLLGGPLGAFIAETIVTVL